MRSETLRTKGLVVWAIGSVVLALSAPICYAQVSGDCCGVRRIPFVTPQQSDQELKTAGRLRAEAEYASGTAALEVYGLMLDRVFVDRETGLLIRWCGCVIMNGADVEAEAYNKRLRELVAEQGLAANANGLKERLDRLQILMQQPPDFPWIDVPQSSMEASSEPVRVGPFTLKVKVDDAPSDAIRRRVSGKPPNGQSEKRSTLQVHKGHTILADIHVRDGQVVATALLEFLDVLVVRLDDGELEKFVFVDTVHGRVI